MTPPLIGVFGYGQGIRERPDVESLEQSDQTGSLLERLTKVNEAILGTDLT